MAEYKPWRPAWLGTAVAVVFTLFISGIAAFMLAQAPRMPLSVLSKLLVLTLCVGAVGFGICFIMWTRYWRHVGWDIGFTAFISGPEPEYDDAKAAWLWGRRLRMEVDPIGWTIFGGRIFVREAAPVA